ncbi:MAG: acyl-CoA desaturase [Granulosicoccus sp.]|nr:acyl-CoA desaturase [Granulosicoccus sp.]
MLLGLWDVSVWTLVAWTALSCHITLLSVTVYLHRSQAHRSVELHPVLQHFFRFWLWLTTGMVTKEWVSVHRKHHARCEGPEDPHSPQVVGIRKVLLEGAELYREAAADPDILSKFGHGTPDDWLERQVYSRYSVLGVASLAVIEFVLFGLAGIAVFAIQMLCVPVLAAGIINGLAHYWGYRNFETDDAATNLTPIAAIICGEELHNNHHAYPSSARFALRRWELDLGWVYLRLFSFLGLARIRRVAPRPRFDAQKTVMDIDTVKAIIASRLHVMESYARRVMKPIHAIELKAAPEHRRTLRKASRDLVKVDHLLDEAARLRVSAALASSETLNTVYELQSQLQAIWHKAGASQESLLHALQDWCRRAEATGIECLEEFAARLHGYHLKPFNG